MDLKLKDVADLLNVSEPTIHRWLLDGFPAYRINDQYRFNRTEIEDWLMSQKVELMSEFLPFKGESKHHLCETEKVQAIKGGIKQFSLYRAIHKGGVIHHLPGETKEEVIRLTMKKLEDSLNVDADVLTDLLLDREKLHPTALNHGIGIPHTRDFLLNSYHDVVTIVFPKNPIAYGALDGKPVHTLFFLFACDDKRHLHLLAKIAHFTSQQAIQELFLSKPNRETVLEKVKAWESNIQRAST